MLKEVHRYSIGVMEMLVDGSASDDIHDTIAGALERVREVLRDIDIDLNLIRFTGPHLTPDLGAYSPFDYLQIGMNEKLEREINFLVIITEVELAASGLSYVVGYSSRLTNIGLISMKRLAPEFWGDPADQQATVRRLAAVVLHTIGHLLNLPHHEDEHNYLFDFGLIEDLDQMEHLQPDQIESMRHNLRFEAREEIAYERVGRFAVRQIFENLGYIIRSAVQANPLKLMTRLPTMVTTGASVAIALFFSDEIWDVAGTVDLYQLVLFGVIAMISATLLLYQVFSFGPLLNRRRGIAESTVVTAATTLLSLLLTMLVLYTVFFALIYLAIITIFPVALMSAWPSIDPAVHVIDHVRLAAFLSGMAILAGSLGGRADSPQVMRSVLFLHEET